MYKKWNKYTLDNISWVEKNRYHPHRKIFEDFVVQHCDSVIEIGPGVMIEYDNIFNRKPDIDYTVVDVSDLFISNCRQKYPNVKIIQSPVEHLTVTQKYDVIYAASVIEHVSDLPRSIKAMLLTSKQFHFVMFKWKYNGELKYTFNKKKKYWSSVFNIKRVLEEIQKHAVIEYTQLVSQNDGIMADLDLDLDSNEIHRNNDYLIIHGKCMP